MAVRAMRGERVDGAERAPGGEGILHVSESRDGKVAGEHVVVAAGVVCRGAVEAVTVVVRGTVEGRVVAANVDVEAGGRIEGEVHASILRVWGAVEGVSRAEKMIVRKGARMGGAVVADLMGAEADCAWRGVTVFAEPGQYMNRDTLRTARALVAAAGVGVEGGGTAAPSDGLSPDADEDYEGAPSVPLFRSRNHVPASRLAEFSPAHVPPAPAVPLPKTALPDPATFAVPSPPPATPASAAPVPSQASRPAERYLAGVPAAPATVAPPVADVPIANAPDDGARGRGNPARDGQARTADRPLHLVVSSPVAGASSTRERNLAEGLWLQPFLTKATRETDDGK